LGALNISLNPVSGNGNRASGNTNAFLGTIMLSFLFGTTSWNFLTTVTSYTGTFRQDYVWSSFRNDIINTGDGNDYVDSGAGNDIINLGNGDDIAFAGNGDDTVDGGDGNDFLDGGNGNDTLLGGAGNDTIDGGAGNDLIRGGSGNDTINAGNGNDTIIYRVGADGNDRINGGRGTDTLVLEMTSAQQASAAFIAERAAFNAYLASGGNGQFVFQSLGLTITGGFEALNIVTIGGPPVNTAPVVSGPVTLAAGTEDTSITISAAALLANATDAEGNVLTVQNLQASNGTIINNGNGTFTFIPAANFNGVITLTYSVSDGSLSTPTSATLNVAAVNDGPTVSAPVTLPAANEDTSITITRAQLLANAGDIDSDTLTVVDLTASSGTLVANADGSYTFTPAANDNSAVTFTYQVSDGTATVTTSATLDLLAVNDGPTVSAPVALPAIDEDTSITITPAQLLANAGDVDGDTLSIVNLTASSGTLVANPDGTYTFTPVANDNSAVTFTYQVSDGTATVSTTASLDLLAVNDGPTVSAPVTVPAIDEDGSTVISREDLLSNANDIDGDALSIINIVSSSGTFTVLETGDFLFIPASNDATSVTFTYTIIDGNGGSVNTQASMDLLSVNDAPIAAENTTLTASNEDTTRIITVAELLAGASDVDGDTLSVVDVVASSGQLVLNGDGSYTYTPALNDNTAVTLTYTITDGNGGSVNTQATIDLLPVNDAPVAGASRTLTASNEDTTRTITAAELLAGASDVDGDTLSIVNLTASSGALLLNEDGSYTFTPDLNDDTTVQFSYGISDGSITVASTASLDLIPVNDLPQLTEASEVNITILNNQTGFGSIAASDVETPAELLTYEMYYEGEVYPQGYVYLGDDGRYEYQPPYGGEEGGPSNFVGTDQFQVKVTDADGGSTIVTVTVNVQPDPDYVNYISGNYNFGDMEGTAFRDVFTFDNSITYESSSGSDTILNFEQGRDLITLTGEPFSVEAILESQSFDEEEGVYTYTIASTGAQISTELALSAADITRELYGTSEDDTLLGSGGVDLLVGFEGDDVLSGGGGADDIEGGAGNDTMSGGSGADRFSTYAGELGDDVFTDFTSGEDTLVFYHSSDAPVEAFLATGVAIGDGYFRYDVAPGQSLTFNTELQAGDIEWISGSFISIAINGTDGSDTDLNGTLYADLISGGSGNDIINAGYGGDTLIGGTGDDVLIGGFGSDVFVTQADGGADIITDFNVLEDYVSIAPIGTVEEFLASEVSNGGTFTYTVSSESTLTVNAQLTANNVFFQYLTPV
jgi:hypothetical protein